MGLLKSRVLEYCKLKNIAISKFEASAELSNGYINNVKNRPSSKTIEKICRAFPDLNPDWLMTGEGAMLLSGSDLIAPIRHRQVPYYDVDFAAGFPLMENDQTAVPSGSVSLPGFEDAECLVKVTGGSMEPLISSGDAVALRRISGTESILYGEVYAIVTDEYRTIKRVRRSDSRGMIRLVPENPDYDPQDIDVSGIRHIYRVLGAVKIF